MTRRSSRFFHAGLRSLILLVAMIFPASGWSQEQQAGAPASDSGTVSLPTATPAQPQPGIAAGSPAAAGEQAGTYTIKEGDTLWDIASAHYRDPFLWPLIWKSNASITDPDLIYPGNSLVIPSLAPVEHAMAEPQEAEKPVQEQAAPAPVAAEPEQAPGFGTQPTEESAAAPAAPASTLILPREATPPLVDKYAMISGGFVGDEPSNDKLIESVVDPEKTLIGNDDEVYISVKSRQDVKVGDRFIIYRPDHTVKHPVTNRSYGPMNIVLGIAKVTTVRDSGIHTARIAVSFDDAERGDLLLPYQEPELLYPSKEKRTKDLSGYVLDVRDRRTLNGQVDVVYLDKGKVDGVDPGDVFTIQANNGSSTNIRRTVGEVQVFLVRDRTATAVVRKSTDAFGRGDRFQFKN